MGWMYSSDVEKEPKYKPNMDTMDYDEYVSTKKAWFKYKHRKIKKHWFVPTSFPAEDVIETYLKPDVDASDERFHWGKPNVEALKTLCRDKFGWDEPTIERTLEPICAVVERGRSAVQAS